MKTRTINILVIALMVIAAGCNPFGSNGVKTVNTESNKSDSIIRTLTANNQSLSTINQWLIGQNRDLQITVDQLSTCCGKRSTSTARRATQPTVSSPQKSTPYVSNSPNAQSSAPVAEKPIAGNFEAQYYEGGIMKFCLRINGVENGYWPDLAIMEGKSFNNGEENHLAGHNLIIPGVSSIDQPSWGVTPDGTFYIYASEIAEYVHSGGSVEVKGTFTFWQARTLTLTANSSGVPVYAYNFLNRN